MLYWNWFSLNLPNKPTECHVVPQPRLFTADKNKDIKIILELLSKIDNVTFKPKNKLIYYYCFILFMISRHITIAGHNKMWVIENLDNIIASYVPKWYAQQS